MAAIGDGWVDGAWVEAGWVTAAEPGGAWSVGAAADTLEQGMKQYRDSRRRCIIALLAGSLAWILM